jgi:hypothetical protein
MFRPRASKLCLGKYVASGWGCTVLGGAEGFHVGFVFGTGTSSIPLCRCGASDYCAFWLYCLYCSLRIVCIIFGICIMLLTF